MQNNGTIFLAVALIEAACAAGVRWQYAITKKIGGVPHYLTNYNVFTTDIREAFLTEEPEEAQYLARGERKAAVLQVAAYKVETGA
jgi:hypothetical protein